MAKDDSVIFYSSVSRATLAALNNPAIERPCHAVIVDGARNQQLNRRQTLTDDDSSSKQSNANRWEL